MKLEFKELIELMDKNLKKCPFVREKNIETYKKNIIEEANEVMESIEKKDYKNLKEELGDLLWDVITLAHIAEKEGHFKASEIMRSSIEKMKRRKPFLLTDEDVNHEEATKIWLEAKEREKHDRT